MLKEKLKNYNIILASKSPRRQQFFKDLNLDFTIQLKEVEEIYPKELKGVEITEFLADLKSKAFTNLSEKDILIFAEKPTKFSNSSNSYFPQIRPII